MKLLLAVGSHPCTFNNVLADLSLALETFYLELSATNPLDAPLAIGGLHIDTDAEVGVVEIDAPQEIELAPRESLRV